MIRSLSLVLLLVSLTACGGGGGGGGAPASGSATAEIHFPTPVTMTDATQIAVRGVASNATAISVNGVAATSTDGFATWTATVPLNFGLNTLFVSTTDAGGGVNTEAASARVVQDPAALTTGSIGAGQSFTIIQDGYLDRANNRLLVTDSSESVLFALPLEAGNRIVLSSDASIGGGAPAALDAPHGLCFDTSGGNIFITDRGLDQVVRVDPTSGLRSVVVDGTTGSPLIGTAEDVEFVPALDLLVWADRDPSGGSRLLSFDLGSGTRAVLSDSMSTGASLNGLDMVRFDPVGNRFLALADDFTGTLFQIDLTNGNRTTIADQSTGTGPGAFEGPTGIGLDAANNRIVTHLRNVNRTVFVDLTTGNRTLISEVGVRGNGPAFGGVQSTEYDDVKQVAYVMDTDAIYVVDAVTGERAIFSR